MTTDAESSSRREIGVPEPTAASRGLRSWFPAVLLALGISLAIVAPFFWLGNASGHDFQYHAQSWLDAAEQWKQGVVYPRWTEWSNYGYGEPRFIFYPPLSWMLGAALGLLTGWRGVPVIFIVLVQTFAGVSAFALARRVLASRRAALFCVACYVANPYALVIVYMRSDFAELLADAFYPLLFLLALKLCSVVEDCEPGDEASARRNIVCFAVAFAATWLSNAPAGVIASYSVALLFAVGALLRKSWGPLQRGTAGLALGLAFTGFYLLPAAYEQRWVNIAQALSTGLLPAENFLYTEINDPEHTFFNWIVSTLAVVMIALTGLAAIVAHRNSSSAAAAVASRSDASQTIAAIQQNADSFAASQRSLWTVLVLLWAAAALLMLRISAIFWALLPKLRFVQFPWRWMSMLAVPFAIFLGLLMARRKRGWVWAVLTFAMLGGASVGLVRAGWWDTEDIPTLRDAIASGQGWDGTDEYDPLGDDHTNLPTTSPEVRVMDTDTMPGPNRKLIVQVEQWAPERKQVSISAPLPFYLGLRLLNYPAWRVELNGTVVKPRGGEDYNMMIVPVPAGDSQLTVRLMRTWDRTAGALVSIAAGLMGCFLWVWERAG